MFSRNSDKINSKLANEFKQEIAEILRKIQRAAEEMDIDELDSLWNQLEQFQFNDGQQEIIDNIHKAILNFDVEYLQDELRFSELNVAGDSSLKYSPKVSVCT